MTRRIILYAVLAGMVLGALGAFMVKGRADAQAGAGAATETVTVEFSDRYQLLAPEVQAYELLSGAGKDSWIIHTDLVLEDGRLLGATPGGVRIRAWTRPIRYQRFTVAVTHAQHEAIMGYAMAQLGKPYSFGGLLLFSFKTSAFKGDGSFICSELVGKAMRAGGVDLTPGMAAEQATPAQMAKSPLLIPEIEVAALDSPR